MVLFLGNQISKWCSFEKKMTYFSHFLVTRQKLQKFLQHISHSHIYTNLLTILTFFALPILKKIRIYQERFLFGMSPGFLFAPFWNNQQITKWWAKFKLECLLLISTYTRGKFIVICKPRTLNDGGEDSVKYRNRKKHRFLASGHFAFYRKNDNNLIASLSQLEVPCLNVTLDALKNWLF